MICGKTSRKSFRPIERNEHQFLLPENTLGLAIAGIVKVLHVVLLAAAAKIALITTRKVPLLRCGTKS
jgi:hypothetical protein